MRLAIDAMGGDHGPIEVCAGVLQGVEKLKDLEVVFIGDENKIKKACEPYSHLSNRYSIVHTDEVIHGTDHPSKAIRSKRNSSLRLALEMVRAKEAAGCISAGNTGAIVAGGVLVVGRVKNVDRPALGIMLPTAKPTLMLDLGATVRCKPLNLVQFAHMGSLFLKSQTDLERPEVKLLSNGSEEIKGDEVIAAARCILSQDELVNYQGYIEANEVTHSHADVVVCDGFTGNVVLKTFEGMASFVGDKVKDAVKQSLLAKLGACLCVPALRELKETIDYQKYGGTPLLGLKGTVVKAHGRSKAKAFRCAVEVAHKTIANRGMEALGEQMQALADINDNCTLEGE